MKLTTEQIKKIIQEELEKVLHESSAIYIDKLEELWQNEDWDQVYELVTSLEDPDIYKWYTGKLAELDQEIDSALTDIRSLKKQRHAARAARQQEYEYGGRWHKIDPINAEIDELENIKIPKAQKRVDSAKRRRAAAKELPAITGTSLNS